MSRTEAKPMLCGATVTPAYPCPEPDGWPQFDVKLTFYVKGTMDHDKVSLIAAQECERVLDLVLDGNTDA